MSATTPAERPAIKKPVLSVTRFERVSSSLIAIVVSLVLGVVFLFFIWLSNRPEKAQSEAELEIVELSGGSPDGAPDETLRVDSPEDVSPDPAVPETPSEQTEVTETIENVLELSNEASMQVPQQFETGAQDTGKSGRATGTGRRALGSGPGEGGFPRHQRWFVRFADRGTLDEYARQLDYFQIELGVLLGGEIVYISNLSSGTPRVRRVNSGKGESRLYFNWQGGSRRQADLKLFEQAGVSVSGGTIFHFYPPEAEALLAKAELSYRNRPVKEIRRTYFTVKSTGSGYQFDVTKQAYY